MNIVAEALLKSCSTGKDPGFEPGNPSSGPRGPQPLSYELQPVQNEPITQTIDT